MRHILSQHQVCFTHDDDMHLNECQMKLRSFAAIRRNLSVWLTMDFGFHFRFVRKWWTENFPRLLVRWRKSQSIEPNIDSNGNRAERCHITYYRYCYACIYWIYFVSFHIFNITRWWIERKIQLAGIDVAVVAPIRSRIRDSMNEWSFRNIFYSLFILVVLIESESNALN